MKLSVLKIASLSHKTILALAGIFLMLFLCVHLLTNLLLLGSSRVAFDAAVEFLNSNPIIKIIEYVLFAGFLIHILMGLIIWLTNLRARPIKYYIALSSDTYWFSKFMIHTGLIIFVFLVIHLVNFYFIKLGWVALPEYANDPHDFYTMAMVLFKDPLYVIVYVISFIFLGFHLNHAFHSAFQTLGLNHDRYFPAIKIIGAVYALMITIGFSIIPIYILFFH